MPIYEYICQDCGEKFEALIRNGEEAACEECGSRELEKQWSVPAAHTGRGEDLPIASAPRRGPCGLGGCGLPECGG